MSETINDFTDFFALDKKKVQFKLIDQIKTKQIPRITNTNIIKANKNENTVTKQ